jgi:hypothetical protein
MNRSFISASLLAAVVGVTVGTDQAEARCCRGQRNRCCRTNSRNYNGYQPGNYAQNSGACCQNGWSTGQGQYATPVMSTAVSPVMSNSVNQSASGYSSPTNIETRPKTSETATPSGPAPAGETSSPASAPRPGI